MSMHFMTVLSQATVVGLVVVAGMTSGAQPAGAGLAAANQPPAALSQSGHNLERPPTWEARYDDDSAGERDYEVMRPGWHIHPGPAGIFWDPGRFATGNYSVTSTIFLFPPGQGDPPSRVEAPYGLVLAGADLEGPRASHVTFLLRDDGSFRVAQHTGAETHEIVAWTPHEAISTWSEALEGTAKNVLVVDATADSVTFWVNDAKVGTVPRDELPMEGTVGLRAGADLSLHISEVSIGPNRR